jgi:hypothetical protein
MGMWSVDARNGCASDFIHHEVRRPFLLPRVKARLSLLSVAVGDVGLGVELLSDRRGSELADD